MNILTTATTVTRPTDPLRREHAGLLPHIESLRAVADEIAPRATAGSPDSTSHVAPAAKLDAALDFLAGHLIPHAEAEDAVLYPAVEEAMRAPGATATMRRDHVEVVRLIDALAVQRAVLAENAWREDARSEASQILHGLHAILSLHFAKEEEIYLEVLDRWLTPDAADALFEAMEAAARRAGTTTHPG